MKVFNLQIILLILISMRSVARAQPTKKLTISLDSDAIAKCVDEKMRIDLEIFKDPNGFIGEYRWRTGRKLTVLQKAKIWYVYYSLMRDYVLFRSPPKRIAAHTAWCLVFPNDTGI